MIAHVQKKGRTKPTAYRRVIGFEQIGQLPYADIAGAEDRGDVIDVSIAQIQKLLLRSAIRMPFGQQNTMADVVREDSF